MGEARRRKLAGIAPDKIEIAGLTPAKIEEQSRDGVFVVGYSVEPIPQLTCVLPIALTMKSYAKYGEPLRSMPYPNLLAALHSEFTEANSHQEDKSIIQFANLIALYAVLRNPLFGREAQALLDEVRRNGRNLGLTVVCNQFRAFAFGVGTGVDNVAMNAIGKGKEQERFSTPHADPSDWRTRVDPEATRWAGMPGELHVTLFEPANDRRGFNHTVSMMVPESSPAEMGHALSIARKASARTTFFCDTAEQAEAMAAYAAPLLPSHRRIAYERAEAGAWGALA